MKILCITDLHENAKALERILADAGPVDLILFGGDITHFGTPDDAERLIGPAGETGTKVLAVAGNCDSAAVDRRLSELGVSLSGRGVMHENIGLHGLPAMPPWRSTMYQFIEAELAEMLEAGYAQIDGTAVHVVLSHAPPHGGKLDRTHLFQHVGSTALREFIDERQPNLVLCGHIHESRGVEKSGRTTIANCGASRARYYAIAEVADGVEVELRRA